MSDSLFLVQEKLANLQAALISKTPDMPVLLRDIHRTLAQDADVVTLLTEEECSILVRGLIQQTNTSMAVIASKKPAKKALSKMTAGDL